MGTVVSQIAHPFPSGCSTKSARKTPLFQTEMESKTGATLTSDIWLLIAEPK